MLQAPDFSAFSPLRAPPNPGRQPITPTDLVNADGLCAGAADAQPVVSADAAPGMPPALPGVALEMSECEVVRRTGRPQEVRIGANEHGDRTAVLIYREGVRPGIYRFRSGRLVSIERGAEPVVDAKPKKPAKKRRSPAG